MSYRSMWGAGALVCWLALLVLPVRGTTMEVFEHSFLEGAESIAYDSSDDQYFVHKGKIAGAKAGFITALFAPNATKLANETRKAVEDFGFCPLAHSMVVVQDCLFVAGAGQICVFNTSSYESLGSLGEEELAGYALQGLGFNSDTQTLWASASGYDLVANAATGDELLASIFGVFDLNGTKIAPENQTLTVAKLTNFSEHSALFPSGLAVEAATGDLFLENLVAGGDDVAVPHAGAVFRCAIGKLTSAAEADSDAAGSGGGAGVVSGACAALAALTRHGVLTSGGAAFDAAGRLYVPVANGTGSSLFRVSGPHMDFLEALMAEEDNGEVASLEGTFSGVGYDSRRSLLLLPLSSSAQQQPQAGDAGDSDAAAALSPQQVNADGVSAGSLATIGANALFQPFPAQPSLEVFAASFIDSAESIAYDAVHDRYFIHRGGVAENVTRAGMLSVLTPTGALIAEDFGYCPLAAGMAVVRQVLYVAGLGKVCAFNTTTLEQLPSIGEAEFAEHQLTGLTAALDTDATFDTEDILGEGFAVLWVTDNGNASYTGSDLQLATDFEESDNYVFEDNDKDSDSDPVVTTRDMIAAIRLIDLSVPEHHCYHCSEYDEEYDSPRFDDSDYEDNERRNATVVIMTEENFAKFGLFPDGITVDPSTGTLFVTNAIGLHASELTRSAGAVQKCTVTDEVDCDPQEDLQTRDYQMLCHPTPATVNCEPLSSATVSLTQNLDGFAKGIHLNADKSLHFALFNHTANQSYVFRIKDPYNDADMIEVLEINEPGEDQQQQCVSNVLDVGRSNTSRVCDLPQDRLIDPGAFGFDTLRDKLLIPSLTQHLYYTLDLNVERGVDFNSFVAREEGAPEVVVEVTNPQFVRAPDSIVYDPVHDQYFIHKGSLQQQGPEAGFISVVTPQGALLQEDFGFCQGALGMAVVNTTLFVGGTGKICQFDTDTLLQLPDIGTTEFQDHQIHGLAHDEFQFDQVLWVSDAGRGLDAGGNVVPTERMIASVRFTADAGQREMERGNLPGPAGADSDSDSDSDTDSDREWRDVVLPFIVITEPDAFPDDFSPNDLVSDPETGSLYVANSHFFTSNGGATNAGAVMRCDIDDDGDMTVDCHVVLATYELGQSADMGAKGIALAMDSQTRDKRLYFSMFNATTSYICRLNATFVKPSPNFDQIPWAQQPSDLEVLVINEYNAPNLTQDRIIDPGSLGLDTRRNRLLIPSTSGPRYYTEELEEGQGSSFGNLFIRGVPAQAPPAPPQPVGWLDIDFFLAGTQVNSIRVPQDIGDEGTNHSVGYLRIHDILCDTTEDCGHDSDGNPVQKKDRDDHENDSLWMWLFLILPSAAIVGGVVGWCSEKECGLLSFALHCWNTCVCCACCACQACACCPCCFKRLRLIELSKGLISVKGHDRKYKTMETVNPLSHLDVYSAPAMGDAFP
uniref:Uncharacterized protein n=1 Tax=Pyramimonas obovata TaxID=1411642 RepID=A0A7S0RS59_9CHLO|mmetsp:Transcript_4971/g.10175  ORF Transcript_4971/g.10175 Transcript_4971/m.10175 type:complete len:1428 (+) Transcript_4971:434-4717(+)